MQGYGHACWQPGLDHGSISPRNWFVEKQLARPRQPAAPILGAPSLYREKIWNAKAHPAARLKSRPASGRQHGLGDRSAFTCPGPKSAPEVRERRNLSTTPCSSVFVDMYNKGLDLSRQGASLKTGLRILKPRFPTSRSKNIEATATCGHFKYPLRGRCFATDTYVEKDEDGASVVRRRGAIIFQLPPRAPNHAWAIGCRLAVHPERHALLAAIVGKLLRNPRRAERIPAV